MYKYCIYIYKYCIYIYLYTYMCVYIYIHMCVYANIYAHTHTHTSSFLASCSAETGEELAPMTASGADLVADLCAWARWWCKEIWKLPPGPKRMTIYSMIRNGRFPEIGVPKDMWFIRENRENPMKTSMIWGWPYLMIRNGWFHFVPPNLVYGIRQQDHRVPRGTSTVPIRVDLAQVTASPWKGTKVFKWKWLYQTGKPWIRWILGDP